eukprot:COSAG01_NODE_76_length_28332_cov_298.876992_6_plen_98_part_00
MTDQVGRATRAVHHRYTSVGDKTCHGGWSPGSLGHWQQDADTFASWGVDYVKMCAAAAAPPLPPNDRAPHCHPPVCCAVTTVATVMTRRATITCPRP